MRLLVYSDANSCAGAERSLATLLAYLAAQFEVTVLGVAPDVVEWIASHRPGTSWRVVRAVRRKRDVLGAIEHQLAVSRARPQVFHANLHGPFSSRGGIAAALATPGVRVMAVEHTMFPASNERERRRKAALSRRLDAHVAVGNRLARELERTYGLSPGSIRTIHTGVPALPEEPLGISTTGPLIGYVGRLSEEKGVDVLVNALTRLADARLVLLGDGPQRAALESLAADVGVSDRVRFEGWRWDARRYLPSFDVLVLPSRLEGFGLSSVEAMLAGVPVVASDVGSVCEAVIDGETGLLVPAGDAASLAAALRRLIGDPELAARMGERGRAVAQERFSPEGMARAFEALYVELLSSGGGAPRRRKARVADPA